MNKNILKGIIWIILTLYMIILIKMILFKYPVCIAASLNWADFKIRLLMSSNFIPFKTIYFYLIGKHISTTTANWNLLGNIAGFIPLGLLAPLVEVDVNSYKEVAKTGLFISFVFELVQLITGLGNFDVDDIILNVFGIILGYAVFKFCSARIGIFKKLLKILDIKN